jgi:hypothetical protein
MNAVEAEAIARKVADAKFDLTHNAPLWRVIARKGKNTRKFTAIAKLFCVSLNVGTADGQRNITSASKRVIMYTEHYIKGKDPFDHRYKEFWPDYIYASDDDTVIPPASDWINCSANGKNA